MGMARAQRWVTCPHTRWLPLRLCLELSPPEEQQPLRPMKDPPRSRQPGAGFLSRMFAGLERVELPWVLPAGGGRRKALAWPGGPPPCFKHHPTPGRGAIYSQMSLGASESLAGLAPGGLPGPQVTLLSVGSSWWAINRDAACGRSVWPGLPCSVVAPGYVDFSQGTGLSQMSELRAVWKLRGLS